MAVLFWNPVCNTDGAVISFTYLYNSSPLHCFNFGDLFLCVKYHNEHEYSCLGHTCGRFASFLIFWYFEISFMNSRVVSISNNSVYMLGSSCDSKIFCTRHAKIYGYAIYIYSLVDNAFLGNFLIGRYFNIINACQTWDA